MKQHRDRRIIVERVIDTDAQRIFDILASPTQHHAIDGSGAVDNPLIDAPERLFLGARFTMRMRTRPPDLTPASLIQVAVAAANRGRLTNIVLEFDEPHRIAWRNFGRHVWRYELNPVAADRTLVRETFDYSTNLAPWMLELARFPETNRVAMGETLDRIADVALRTRHAD